MSELSKASDAPSPRETPLGKFFRDTYKVGKETLTRDIPTYVLLEILATALLILRSSLLGVFGSHAERVRSHWLDCLVLRPALWTFFFLATMSRTRGTSVAWYVSTLWLLGVIALLVLIIFESWIAVAVLGVVLVVSAAAGIYIAMRACLRRQNR